MARKGLQDVVDIDMISRALTPRLRDLFAHAVESRRAGHHYCKINAGDPCFDNIPPTEVKAYEDSQTIPWLMFSDSLLSAIDQTTADGIRRKQGGAK